MSTDQQIRQRMCAAAARILAVSAASFQDCLPTPPMAPEPDLAQAAVALVARRRRRARSAGAVRVRAASSPASPVCMLDG